MRFTTISGSTYEINKDQRLIRRLNGRKDPTPRQGKDGEWREYLEPLIVRVGSPVVIQWADEHTPTAETVALFEELNMAPPAPYKGSLTTTSRVTEVDDRTYN